MNMSSKPRSIWILAGEESGDQLGAKLIPALKERFGDDLVIHGLGGRAMEEQGVKSLFPISEIAVMGASAVIRNLARILKYIQKTADAIIADKPDILVIIDSPDFSHRVAKAVRKALPDMVIIDYVSPSVWAWRPGRAKGMTQYIDAVLAILPFEPEVHKKLNGPLCVYVGHPLIERIEEFRPRAAERSDFQEDPFRLVVLPGSRKTEIHHLMDVFGKAVYQFVSMMKRETSHREFDIILPAVPHLKEEIEKRLLSWEIKPRLVHGKEEKLTAFRSAHLALAASGTVTLELALAQVPMVVAYKVSKLESQLRFLIKADSIVLTNLILGEKAVPEYIQEECNPPTLALALCRYAKDGKDRRMQMAAFERLEQLMSIAPATPSGKAAEAIEDAYRKKHEVS